MYKFHTPTDTNHKRFLEVKKLKIGQGKSNKGIKPKLEINPKENDPVNHPDKTSQEVKIHNMTAGAYAYDGSNKINPPKNIAYTFEDLREDQ